MLREYLTTDEQSNPDFIRVAALGAIIGRFQAMEGLQRTGEEWERQIGEIVREYQEMMAVIEKIPSIMTVG